VSLTRTPTELYGFEGGTDGWSGHKTKNGPWPVTEWAASFLLRRFSTPADLSARTTLTATVRTAAWGSHGEGTLAKPYVKSGPDCAWHDGGTHAVGSSAAGTVVSYNLAGVTGRDRVCEIGMQFVYDTAATGGSAVYVDRVVVR
jgi:mannan endo-1,4-beta-mannosidase